MRCLVKVEFVSGGGIFMAHSILEMNLESSDGVE